MKSISISNKMTKQIKEVLTKSINIDAAYSEIVSIKGLYGVAFFGHGNKYLKRKCELIWRNVLFIAYDFKEFNHLIENNKQSVKNYLKIS